MKTLNNIFEFAFAIEAEVENDLGKSNIVKF